MSQFPAIRYILDYDLDKMPNKQLWLANRAVLKWFSLIGNVR